MSSIGSKRLRCADTWDWKTFSFLFLRLLVLLIHSLVAMSTGRITGRWTWPQRRAFYWWKDSGRSRRNLMILNKFAIIGPLSRGSLLIDPLAVVLYILQLLLCFFSSISRHLLYDIICYCFLVGFWDFLGSSDLLRPWLSARDCYLIPISAVYCFYIWDTYWVLLWMH